MGECALLNPWLHMSTIGFCHQIKEAILPPGSKALGLERLGAIVQRNRSFVDRKPWDSRNRLLARVAVTHRTVCVSHRVFHCVTHTECSTFPPERELTAAQGKSEESAQNF